MVRERIASCNCGAVRLRCVGEPARNSVCHCLACKRRTGSAFSWNATFDRDKVVVTGASSSFTRQSDEGRWCTYRFCPACGATVCYEIEVRPGRISVPVGAFADPGFPEPTISVYVSRCEGWIAFKSESPLTEE